MEKKYLSVPFEIKVANEEGDFFTFEGFASTFGNTDLDDDIIGRGAFTESLKKRIPKLLWQHSMDEPLGIFTSIEERDTGLFVKGRMPLEDTFVNGRVIPQIKVGSITSMSIGFFIVESTFNRELETRFISQLELFEISLVSIPANPQAVITSFKRADMDNFFQLPVKSQEELFTSGVKFSNRTAKQLVGVLKDKNNGREVHGEPGRDDRDCEIKSIDKFIDSFVIDRDDQALNELGHFLKSFDKEDK